MPSISKENLRIVFMGTPDFAVHSLNTLVENKYNIVGVITAPDKPAGRGRKLGESAVKKYAVEKGLNILQPTNLKSPEFNKELQELKPDLQIVVAFRMLPEMVWNLPPLGTFNLHASLLPKYRGAAPINWAVMNGEKESGVSTFFLTHEIDTGDIILQEKIAINETDTAGDLHDNLMHSGSKLIIETVKLIQEGNVKTTKQIYIEDKHSKAPKLFKSNTQIDFTRTGTDIYNHIRGLSPYPAAWFMFYHPEKEKKFQCKILQAKLHKKESTYTGKIISQDNQLFIPLEGMLLEILEIQVEGKKRMKSADLLRGFSINDCKIL